MAPFESRVVKHLTGSWHHSASYLQIRRSTGILRQRYTLKFNCAVYKYRYVQPSAVLLYCYHYYCIIVGDMLGY